MRNVTSFGLTVADTFDYGPDDILSLKTSSKLFGSSSSLPSVGNCYSAEIDVTLRRPSDTIPRMAKLVPYVVANSVTKNKGLFFIDTREIDSADDTIEVTDTLTIHGYDPMLKTEQSAYIIDKTDVPDWTPNTTYYVDEIVKNSTKYYRCTATHTSGGSFDSTYWEETEVGDQGTWPKTDIQVVNLIATRIGVNVNAATTALMTQAFNVEYPGYGDEGYSLREVLGYIGAMYCGNWIINDDGELQLIQLNETRTVTEVQVYEDPTTATAGSAYSRVTIDLGSGYYITAGDDGGQELLVVCPWGTQAIANYILSIVDGFTYIPYTITNALYNPGLALGDKITIDDITSYIYSLDIDFDYMMTADISAPTDSEIDHEYEFKDKFIRDTERLISQLKTSLIVQAGKIQSLIEGEVRTFRGNPETAWAANTSYSLNQFVINSGTRYFCIQAHTSGATFEPLYWDVFHEGDLWYCEQTSGSYKADTWYRFNDSTDMKVWEETTVNINVAPAWDSETTYVKGDAVTAPNGKWYVCKKQNTNVEPPNTTYWEETTSITSTSKSQILQTINSIQLEVVENNSKSAIRIYGQGIDFTTDEVYFYTNNAHFTGTLTAAKLVALGDGVDGHILVKSSDGETDYGYVGLGTGYDGVTNTTGIVLKRGNENGLQNYYLIVTDAGVRMQAGNHSIYVTSSGCYADGVLIGTAVFG